MKGGLVAYSPVWGIIPKISIQRFIGKTCKYSKLFLLVFQSAIYFIVGLQKHLKDVLSDKTVVYYSTTTYYSLNVSIRIKEKRKLTKNSFTI